MSEPLTTAEANALLASAAEATGGDEPAEHPGAPAAAKPVAKAPAKPEPEAVEPEAPVEPEEPKPHVGEYAKLRAKKAKVAERERIAEQRIAQAEQRERAAQASIEQLRTEFQTALKEGRIDDFLKPFGTDYRTLTKMHLTRQADMTPAQLALQEQNQKLQERLDAREKAERDQAAQHAARQAYSHDCGLIVQTLKGSDAGLARMAESPEFVRSTYDAAIRHQQRYGNVGDLVDRAQEVLAFYRKRHQEMANYLTPQAEPEDEIETPVPVRGGKNRGAPQGGSAPVKLVTKTVPKTLTSQSAAGVSGAAPAPLNDAEYYEKHSRLLREAKAEDDRRAATARR